MTTIIVCGGRSYGLVPAGVGEDVRGTYENQAAAERERLTQILDAAVVRLGLTHLACGDATGADALAAAWAEGRKIPFQIYAADWQAQGKAAGPLRNRRMLEEEVPSAVIAFPGSKGTRNMCDIAERAGVRVIKVDW
ncbi:MAG TPA: SLOG family protein [Bosea sp. (in: a-proteobacteria)]|uniref:SLOG family protein n=1 Tax=Bosea sp. (in: a-proteobacteria) TaxID=1871050 RepID=UPI002E1242C1|nr:SLOG family protein [Bosea sp. (in: a-proteobacteria)]